MPYESFESDVEEKNDGYRTLYQLYEISKYKIFYAIPDK